MTSKQCTVCGDAKATSEFGPKKGYAGGLNSRCRPCDAAYTRSHRATTDFGARQREGSRAWKAAHPEHARDWIAKQHPDYGRLQTHKQKARDLGVESTLTLDEWDAIVAEFDGCCAYCLEPSDCLEIEHMTPMRRGGANVANNVVPACRRCNSQKGSRTMLEFLSTQSVLI